MSKSTEYVPIVLDKPRRLRFSFNSLAAFEKEMGKSIPNFLSDLVNQNSGDSQSVARAFGVLEIRALLWAGLLHEDKRLTIEQAGDLIEHADGASFGDKIRFLTDKVFEAFFAFQGPDSKKKYQEIRAASLEE